MFDIKELFLFSGLDDGDTAMIVSGLPEAQKFKRGERIFAPSSFEKAIGIFLSGSGIAKSDDVFKNTFKEGSVFGAAAVFGAGSTYISEIIAKTDCTVQLISESKLREILRAYPICAENYIIFLTGRIRYLNQKIKQFTGTSAASKLYRYFVDNVGNDGYVAVTNMSAIAHLTGMGRTSLYRALGELENSGAIIRENGKIIVR